MSKYNVAALQAWAEKSASQFWGYAQDKYAEIGFPIGNMPTVKMNSRLTSTAGRAWTEKHMIDLSCYLMTRNFEAFHTDTIPHELCHIIASKHFGSKGHDKAWYDVINFLRVNTSRCHSMKTKYQAERDL